MDFEVDRVHQESLGPGSRPRYRGVLRAPDRGASDGRQSRQEPRWMGGSGLRHVAHAAGQGDLRERHARKWTVDMARDLMLTRTPLQSLQFMHRDIVFEYPEGVEQLGSNPVCAVQGMYVRKRLITVQGHPEFNEEIMTEILDTRHKMGIFDDEAFDAAMTRVVKPHDGLVVSKAFLRFLLDD